MTPRERYDQLLCTDTSDPVVAADIQRGARWSYGETDVHWHLPLFRELAKGNVLEIGVRFGSSTAALLLGVEEQGGHLWSADIEDCSRLYEGHPQWTFIRIDSVMYPESLVQLTGQNEFDLVFIDGDHSYEGVRADLMNFGPLAKMIMCHDYNRMGNPQVMCAVGNYLRSQGCRHKKLQVSRLSNGLAVIK